MMRYVLSPRARSDVEEIWDYTEKRWGPEQAEKYVRALQQAFETVARDPRRGRPSDDIRIGYRRYSVGSHVVFFRLVGGEIDVVRVLHQSMDLNQHL